MDDAGISSDDQAKFAERVNTYIKLREVIGRASGDFLDFKQFEPGMRYLIDNYIVADDAEKIAIFDDFTLLDFIIEQEDKLNKDGKKRKFCYFRIDRMTDVNVYYDEIFRGKRLVEKIDFSTLTAGTFVMIMPRSSVPSSAI